jgi:hypothetical protein
MWTVELASTAVAECCKLQEILVVIMFDKTVWLSPHEPLVPLWVAWLCQSSAAEPMAVNVTVAALLHDS